MKKSEKVLNFIKNNLVYVILAFCILAVGLSIALTVVSNNKQQSLKTSVEKEEEKEGETEKVFSMIMPVSNYIDVEDYSTKMVFNETLKRYSAHKATDFIVENGTEVYAVEDGVIESVDNSVLKGYTVVINHQNGLKTLYNSLEETDISVGTVVKKGDVIGVASNTNRQENYLGTHLHFEILSNGESVDPENYLVIDKK